MSKGWIGTRRCIGCGKFLRKSSRYRNQCSDCWTEEDEFPGEGIAIALEMNNPKLYKRENKCVPSA
jgi:hypothetical protein